MSPSDRPEKRSVSETNTIFYALLKPAKARA